MVETMGLERLAGLGRWQGRKRKEAKLLVVLRILIHTWENPCLDLRESNWA
jgi:hypothetical protein